MQNNSFYYLIAFLMVVSCAGSADKKANSMEYFEVTKFFNAEVVDLNKTKPEIEKIIMHGENPETISTKDVDWAKELEPFFNCEINKSSLANKYNYSLDSNKGLQIEYYTAKDSILEVQDIVITSKNKKTLLVTSVLRKRSWLVDRDMQLSYQPGKGYGIVVKENYLWKKANGYEIFVQIKNPKLYYR